MIRNLASIVVLGLVAMASSKAQAVTVNICGEGDYRATYAVVDPSRAYALREGALYCHRKSSQPAHCSKVFCKAVNAPKAVHKFVILPYAHPIIPSHYYHHGGGSSGWSGSSGSEDSSNSDPTPSSTPPPRDTSPRLCPDGRYHAGGCNLCPDGEYHGGESCNLAPDGHYHGGDAHLCPDGKYHSGNCTLCPDGNYHGDSCTLAPDGHYHGSDD